MKCKGNSTKITYMEETEKRHRVIRLLTGKMTFWRILNFEFPVLSEPPPTSLSRIRSQRPLERRFVEEILQKEEETSSSSSLYLMKARKKYNICTEDVLFLSKKCHLIYTLLVNMPYRLIFFKWIQQNLLAFQCFYY